VLLPSIRWELVRNAAAAGEQHPQDHAPENDTVRLLVQLLGELLDDVCLYSIRAMSVLLEAPSK